MNIYEVIFWGSHGNADAEDTIYLVRAPDFRAAVDEVARNASPNNYSGQRSPLANIVYELGSARSKGGELGQQILRGPYFHFAYNHGWRSWQRKVDRETSDHTLEWEEDIHEV